jgi:hypothetical protein
MANPSLTVDQNLLPVQAYFNLDGSFNTFIGQNQPFYATANPIQTGLTITNSTLDNSPIGATTPSTGAFTNLSTITGQISTSPSNASDIANKLYVDTVAQGLGPKAACAVGTTVSITLSGLQTIDTYTTLSGDRVLVKNQGTSSQNGIYIASASAWTRASDMNVWSEVSGAYTVLLNGSQANTGWVCTASSTGTIGVTAMPWVQFSGNGSYFAGTGLTLSSNTFSLTNTTVTAASYGSASSVGTFTVNAQGQLTSAATTAIAIGASQITSGTISSSLISGSYTGITGVGTLTAGTWNASLISPTYGGTGASNLTGYLYANGASAATASTTIPNTSISGLGTMSTQNANNVSITGGSITGTPLSGSTVGGTTITASTQFSGPGTGLTGTATSLNIGGNAATVTNGVYTTGSYSNPAWITSILGSIVSGAVASATAATNVAGGSTGALPYQTGASASTFLSLGTSGYVLTAGASAPTYVAQSTLSVGSASTATSATTATNLAGGIASQIPYQTGAGATSFVANGTTGQVLTSNGTSAPSWTTPTAYATVTDDTTTNATRYPLFANQTSGNLTTEYTSSTKLQYNPSTGLLTSTAFSGSGASLTSLNASNLSSGTVPSAQISGSYTGITSVGTLATGTWNATTIGVAYGGTGLTSTPANGALDIGNGTGFTRTTLTAGTGITITNASGSITVATSGGSGATITDDTTTNGTRYINFTSATSGSLSTIYTSSTKLTYNPSTGLLTTTAFSGSGASLTSLNASNISSGTLAIANGGTGSSTATGSGSNVLATSPTITGLTFTSAASAAPSFSAYQSVSQSLTASTYTKLNFQTKEWDTNSNFDNTTNYRFTPTVAGYYQVSGAWSVGTSYAVALLVLYKNNASYKFLYNGGNASTTGGAFGSCLVYLNGSTDYIELYAWSALTNTVSASATNTYFQAAFVRSA